MGYTVADVVDALESGDDLFVMGDDDDAHAHGIAQAQDQIVDAGRHHRVQPGRGLVAE